jgi:hypothetical protein
LVCSPSLINAQSSSAGPADTDPNKSCNAFAIQSATELTLKQRGCYFGRKLISPKLAVTVGLLGVFDQYRNSPTIHHNNWSRFPHRLETYYARHAARDSAELLAGYFHHEDPRPYGSHAGSFWRRSVLPPSEP